MKPAQPERPDEPYRDPVVDAFKPGVDVTLLDRNLRLTPTQRLEQLQAFVAFLEEAGRAGRAAVSTRDEPAH